MKTVSSPLTRLALSTALALLAASCSLPRTTAETTAASAAAGDKKKSGTTAKQTGKAEKAASAKDGDASPDGDDEYAVVEVADPIEKINRGTFWLNDKLYTVLLRPISKGYQFVFPRPVRKGIDNAFDNVKFPVRFVNSALQGKFKRAGQETGKFVVNTVAGVGGVLNVSDKVPALAHVPAEDTGQTFATWGIGHGAYVVLPFFGPSSLRDGVGMAGDYLLNPVNWGIFYHGGHDWEHDWTYIPAGANTLRSLPAQLETYDSATKDAVDPYISVRSIYVQAREDAAKK